jgi:hypothetical protein
MDALVVPANPTEPVRLIDLDAGSGSLSKQQQAEGGWMLVGSTPTKMSIYRRNRLCDAPTVTDRHSGGPERLILPFATPATTW